MSKVLIRKKLFYTQIQFSSKQSVDHFIGPKKRGKGVGEVKGAGKCL